MRGETTNAIMCSFIGVVKAMEKVEEGRRSDEEETRGRRERKAAAQPDIERDERSEKRKHGEVGTFVA